VQTVIDELNGEKIDIIQYSDDPIRFLTAALAPAEKLTIELNEEERIAVVTVAEDQLSLAIGREGQNVRLAAKLTGYKIDIKGPGGMLTESEKRKEAQKEKEEKEAEETQAEAEASKQEPATQEETAAKVDAQEKVEKN
jgi:transcription termination/antitermination protein NusA